MDTAGDIWLQVCMQRLEKGNGAEEKSKFMQGRAFKNALVSILQQKVPVDSSLWILFGAT